MKSALPLIVGFGGFNAAGRSSGHQAYRRMIFESLGTADKARTVSGLGALMGNTSASEAEVLAGTLVRKIEPELFDPDNVPTTKKFTLDQNGSHHVGGFTISQRQMPDEVPSHWQIDPLDDEGRLLRVTLTDHEEVKFDLRESLAVKAAGQLPRGFDPGSHYRSHNHPRGLQLAVLGASDAVRSMGVDWDVITQLVSPDQIAVHSASIMSQLDKTGFGGLFNARSNDSRVTSKQLALGLNTMPADFVNAYVLGSMGSTGAITGACATFLYNLKQGVEDIRSGRRQVAVVGASEAPILPEIIDGYGAMGALASDENLSKLDGAAAPDYRRASRPFGENCGFTIAESSQYVVLMSERLAMEVGAKVYGAVPGVYVNADGYKKSISAPGAGNYVTMAKAVGLANSLLGADAVRKRSFVQAHGSSTPQNRITESKIFDAVAQAFGISSWPIAAVKAYLGHSLASASGDQLAASLGIFSHGILPGIKTLDRVADDVHGERLNLSTKDLDLGVESVDVAFLNSKGFGGNNATASVFSPSVVDRYLAKQHGANEFSAYQKRREQTEEASAAYLQQADNAELKPIYNFGKNIVKEDEIELSHTRLKIPGYACEIDLSCREDFAEF